MDIGKSFTYITEDEKWVSKLGVGALISMIPFVNFALFGYQVQIARNVWQGEERPLPTWDEFGKLFMDGLRFMTAMIVYMLPVFLIYSVIMGAAFIFAFSADAAAYDPSSSGSIDPFMGIPFALMMLSMICIMPYSFVLYGLVPLFLIQIARRNSVKACFDFREMWALLKAQPVNYIIMIAILFGLYIVVSVALMPFYVVSFLIPCIGFLIMMLAYGVILMLLSVVSGHLEGQFILEGEEPNLLNGSGIEKQPI